MNPCPDSENNDKTRPGQLWLSTAGLISNHQRDFSFCTPRNAPLTLKLYCNSLIVDFAVIPSDLRISANPVLPTSFRAWRCSSVSLGCFADEAEEM